MKHLIILALFLVLVYVFWRMSQPKYKSVASQFLRRHFVPILAIFWALYLLVFSSVNLMSFPIF